MNSELQGLEKELIMACFKLLSLHLHLDQLRETTPPRYRSEVSRSELSCLVAPTEPLSDSIIKSVENSFRFPDTENVYSTGACNLVHLYI
jgi:hypothetical protein